MGFALEDLLNVNFTLQRVGASVGEIGIDSRATLDDMLTAREKLIETQGSTSVSNPLAKTLLLATGGGPREGSGGGGGGVGRRGGGSENGGGSDSDPNLTAAGFGGSGATLRRTR